MLDLSGKTILVTGGEGFLGHHLVPLLKAKSNKVYTINHKDSDLLCISTVQEMYWNFRPNVIIHLAARVGGIQYNQLNPATLFYENLQMGINILHYGKEYNRANGNMLEKFVCIGTVCFPEGTKIICNPSVQDIKDIRIGDRVLTDNGIFNKVTNTFRRAYNGTLVTVMARGVLPLSSTPNHKFKVMTRLGKSRNSRDWNKWSEEWKSATELKIGDYLVVPTLAYTERVDNLLLTRELCELFGIFVAEGTAHFKDTGTEKRRGSVYFSFGNEPAFIKRTRELMKKYFHLQGCLRKIANQKGYQLNYYNIPLAMYFSKLFYSRYPHRSLNKIFPWEVLLSSDEKIIAALSGHFRGDGCFHKTAEGRISIIFSTISEELAWQIKLMLGEIGVYGHIHKRKHPKVGNIMGRKVRIHDSFSVRVNGNKQVKHLRKLLNFKHSALSNLVDYKARVCRKDGNYLTPIFRLQKRKYVGDVYNLEVENRQTYCANGLVVHNCSYPKIPHIPFRESDLWNGFPEETNAAYGIAKKALLTMCQAYRQQYNMNCIYLIPINLYGEFDSFDDTRAHVIPMLVKRFLQAKEEDWKEVEVWGTGNATREFMYAGNAAKAIIRATEVYDEPEPLNIGTGEETSIVVLAGTIADIIGYKGNIVFNNSMPDGQPRRVLDITRMLMELGIGDEFMSLENGLRKTIEWYKENR